MSETRYADVPRNINCLLNQSFWLTAALHYSDLVLEKGAIHKVRHAIFGQFLPLLCHTSSHIQGPPESTSHISDTPPISRRPSTRNPDKSPFVQNLFQLFARVFVRGGFVWKVLSGVIFVRSRSVRIHLLHQKVKHHFKFHV